MGWDGMGLDGIGSDRMGWGRRTGGGWRVLVVYVKRGKNIRYKDELSVIFYH